MEQQPYEWLKANTSIDTLKIVAIVLFSFISTYTTGVGFQNIWASGGFMGTLIAWAFAVGVSSFLIYCSLKIPDYVEQGRAWRLIVAFLLFAMLSLFFNFNAIYDLFRSDDILRDELERVDNKITSMHTYCIDMVDKEYKYSHWQKQVDSLNRKADAEENHALRPGKKSIYQGIVDKRVDAEAELEAARKKFEPFKERIDNIVIPTQNEIDSVHVESEYYKAIKRGCDVHNEVGTIGKQIVGDKFEFMGMKPKTKGGEPAFALGVLIDFLSFNGKLSSEDSTSVILSLAIGFLLDFPIFFVLIFLNQSTRKKPKKRNRKSGNDIFGDENNGSRVRKKQGKIKWD